jgi:hypothetical protein
MRGRGAAAPSINPATGGSRGPASVSAAGPSRGKDPRHAREGGGGPLYKSSDRREPRSGKRKRGRTEQGEGPAPCAGGGRQPPFINPVSVLRLMRLV